MTTPRWFFWLTLPLALLVAVASIGGAFFDDNIYAAVAPTYAAQGVGQDWVDLLLIAPLLVVTAAMMRRGSRTAMLVWSGLVTYTAYSFVLYCFSIQFNALFLVYTVTLGLAFYLLVGYLMNVDVNAVKAWYGNAPMRLPAIYLIVAAAFFYFAWLSEIIPALLNGTLPESVVKDGLLTHPIAVLDIGLVLPMFILSGVMLLRRQALGYVLAPMGLAFSLFMSVAILGMIASMALRGLATLGEMGIFVPMALLAIGALGIFMKRMERA